MGMLAGMKSEQVAGFVSESMAGFIGIPVGRSKSPGYGHLKLPHLMVTGSATEQR